MRMHVMKNTLLSQVSVVKRKHDSNCYPQSSRPSIGRSRRLNAVSIYFAEAPHFTEHQYIPHEIRTICLDFTMWTSHCSRFHTLACMYIPYYVYSIYSGHIFKLGMYSIVPGIYSTRYIFHIFDPGMYSTYSEHIFWTPHWIDFTLLLDPGMMVSNGLQWYSMDSVTV